MNKVIIVGILLMSFLKELETRNKLVVIVSTPRSMSTVLLRSIKQCSNFVVFNEPGIRLFQEKYLDREGLEHFNTTAMYTSFGELRTYIENQLRNNNVCIKEMSAAAEEYLCDGNEILHNTDCYVIFLIRNPHGSLMSTYLKLQELEHDPIVFGEKFFELTEHIMSYKKLYEFYCRVEKCSYHHPVVVCAEDLAMNPEATLRALYNYMEIPFDESCLQWTAYDGEFSPREVLGDMKDHEVSAFWHAEALKSTRFHALTTYGVDSSGQPTFEEIANDTIRANFLEWYRVSYPYYELLKLRELGACCL